MIRDVPSRDLLVLTGSGSDVPALASVLAALPRALPAAVLVVGDLPAVEPLVALLVRHSRLPVEQAVDGAELVDGRVLVAPPTVRLRALGDVVVLGLVEEGERAPAGLDGVLPSAARVRGPRVVGVVLAGLTAAGRTAAGLRAVARSGGAFVLQDADQELTPVALAAAVVALVGQRPGGAPVVVAGETSSEADRTDAVDGQLQTAVAELGATNEVLQSTGRTLEHLNAALQGTNEELQALNDELHDRLVEVDGVNRLLRRVLTRLDVAVVVVDQHGQVRLWNEQAEQVVGLRPPDAERRSVTDLPVRLSVDVAALLAEVVEHARPAGPLPVDVTDGAGRVRRRRLVLEPLQQAGTVEGAVLSLLPPVP